MNIDRAINLRRSIRGYKNKKVPRDIACKIIDSGRMAPSLHNLQPWHFIVLDSTRRKEIAKIMRKRSEKEFIFLNTVLKENALAIENAPLAIAVYNTGPLSRRLRRFGRFYENRSIIWESQSIACCIENMLLKARSLGLGSAFIGCVLLCDKAINKLLGAKGELMAVVTLGYSRKIPKKLKRKPLKEVTTFL